jgi:membrane protein implicated in regulation of membrane protease activity
VRRFARDNGLSLTFLALLLAALAGQALTGRAFYDDAAADAGLPLMSLGDYVTSSQFAVDVAENWQSEYLQFLLYIVLTVWLVQRGSPESKRLDSAGLESDEDQKVGPHATPDSPAWVRRGGWRTHVYSHSLALTMGAIFVLSWLAQLVAGRSAFNAEQLQDLQEPLSMGQYLVAPDFWNRTLQNWQSELLAVASMVVLSIYLRERGSPESKPVGESHLSTGEEG